MVDDFRVTFTNVDTNTSFGFQLNTAMIAENKEKILLTRSELDGDVKNDIAFKIFPQNFSVVVKFDHAPRDLLNMPHKLAKLTGESSFILKK